MTTSARFFYGTHSVSAHVLIVGSTYHCLAVHVDGSPSVFCMMISAKRHDGHWPHCMALEAIRRKRAQHPVDSYHRSVVRNNWSDNNVVAEAGGSTYSSTSSCGQLHQSYQDGKQGMGPSAALLFILHITWENLRTLHLLHSLCSGSGDRASWCGAALNVARCQDYGCSAEEDALAGGRMACEVDLNMEMRAFTQAFEFTLAQ